MEKCVERLKDPSKPIPARPNREASFNPRRSRRQKKSSEEERNSEDKQEEEKQDSPNEEGSYSDALTILELNYGATRSGLKIKFRTLARKYHPDQHNPENNRTV